MNATSESRSPNIIFLHGLNTFGDDLLHLGPVSLGRMDFHLRTTFEKLGAKFYSVDGIGAGSPEEQAKTCLERMARMDIASNDDVILLGHSMGGLVARVLAARLKDTTRTNAKRLRVRQIISWGTPHHGTLAVNLTFLKRDHPTFRHYSPASLRLFNDKFPVHAAAPEHAFVCDLPRRFVAPYFWGIMLVNSERRVSSDGFITLTSQTWGNIHGPYNLDHFAQIGYRLHPQTKIRTQARAEFEKLCHDMYRLMTSA